MDGSKSKAAANCCCMYCRCYCIRRTAGFVQLIKQEILCFYTESPSGTYSGNNLIGVIDNNYILKVSTGGQTYMANSILPVKIAFDSLTYKDDDLGNTKHIKELTVHFKDPVGVRNQYRFVVTVNGQQVKRIFAYNDDFTDGRDVHQKIMQDDRDILKGDTVVVEMQCIDKPFLPIGIPYKPGR